jgi:hypothetical protein
MDLTTLRRHTMTDRRKELRAAIRLGLGPIRLPPPEVLARILRLRADTGPEAAELRNRIARRAEPFSPSTGFPVRLDADAADDAGAGSDADSDHDPE